MIEKIILLDIDELFIKLTICVMTEKEQNPYFNKCDVYSIPFIPRLAAIMANDGYITSDEAKSLIDSTGYYTSNSKQFNSISALKDMESSDSTISVLPITPDKALILSKDLFPYAFPLLGLYDEDMTFDDFVAEARKNERLVEWQVNNDSSRFVMRMDKLSRDGIINLFKTYYEYLQWKNR